MYIPREKIALRWTVAAALITAAALVTKLLWSSIQPNISPIFFVAVMATAWFSGLRPALASALVAAAYSNWLTLPLGFTFSLGDFIRAASFFLVAGLVSWLNEARARVDRALTAASELEVHLKDRTAELESANARLRQLAAELSLTEERERRRIATLLHDDLGQSLALSQMKLESLRDAAPAPLSAAIAEVSAVIESAVAHTRSLTRELSPPVLYEPSFEAAADWLAERMQREHQLRVEVNNVGQARPLPDEIRVFLFQALRELLINVVKHAKASSAEVTVFHHPRSVRLMVEDDGCGFDSALPPRGDGGFGLLNIRERINYLGGQLEVDSAPGRGTRFTLTAPVAPGPSEKTLQGGASASMSEEGLSHAR